MNWIKKLFAWLRKIMGTDDAETPTPTPTPEPTPAPADAIDLATVIWLHASPEKFPVTATLKDIAINGKTISWTWTQPGWPVPAGITNSVIGNMWVFALIEGKRYAATWEWLRANTNRVTLEAEAGQPPFVQSKASPISSWYPRSGETLHMMASTICRGGYQGTVRGRSPVVAVQWP